MIQKSKYIYNSQDLVPSTSIHKEFAKSESNTMLNKNQPEDSGVCSWTEVVHTFVNVSTTTIFTVTIYPATPQNLWKWLENTPQISSSFTAAAMSTYWKEVFSLYAAAFQSTKFINFSFAFHTCTGAPATNIF